MRVSLKDYRDPNIDYEGGLSELDFDITRIDLGARELVKFLRDNNFNTHSSCQGGYGHWERYLAVEIRSDNLFIEKARLKTLLLNHNYKNFYISIVDVVGQSGLDSEEYIKLEMTEDFNFRREKI